MNTANTTENAPESFMSKRFAGGRVDMVIVEVNGFLTWKARKDLQENDFVCFYDGDYSDVLETNDERVLAQSKH